MSIFTVDRTREVELTFFNVTDDSPFWDVFYDIENLIDYWSDDRIDHAFFPYQQWADMVIY